MGRETLGIVAAIPAAEGTMGVTQVRVGAVAVPAAQVVPRATLTAPRVVTTETAVVDNRPMMAKAGPAVALVPNRVGAPRLTPERAEPPIA